MSSSVYYSRSPISPVNASFRPENYYSRDGIRSREQEIAKEIERKRILALKTEFEQLQVDEDFFKNDIEAKIRNLEQEIAHNRRERQKAESENQETYLKCQETENNIKEIKSHIHQYQLTTGDTIRGLEEKYNVLSARSMGLDDQHTMRLENLELDSKNTLNQIHNKWERRFYDLTSHENDLKVVIENLINEIGFLTQKMMKMKTDNDEKMKLIDSKCRLEEARKNTIALRQHESRLQQSGEIKGKLVRRNQDLLRETEDMERRHKEEAMHIEGEISKYQMEISDNRSQISELSYEVESTKSQVREVENQIGKLECDIKEFRKILDQSMKIERDQLADYDEKYSNERKSHEERRDAQQRRIDELEKMIRTSESQLHRARIEHNRLMESVVLNVKKAVTQTIGEQRHIMEMTNTMAGSYSDKRARELASRYPEMAELEIQE